MDESGRLSVEDSWEDPNLDEHGKALWGVPGAGTYETVASIGRTQVFPNAPTYTFGVHHKKNPFVSKQHDKNDYGGCDSPGPVYKPETRALSKSTRGADFSFGSADRGAGRLQYISKVRFPPHAAVAPFDRRYFGWPDWAKPSGRSVPNVARNFANEKPSTAV